MGTQDTICAIATPLGQGGIGIVRVSGNQAISFADKVVLLRSGQGLAACSSHRFYRAEFLKPASLSVGRERSPGIIDQGLVVVMNAPHSFTGETVVEIHCHGGPLVLELLCKALNDVGVRSAHPGEFTKRAFLNGKLDLTQAEAVLDTIQARTEQGLRIAQEQLQGQLSAHIEKWRERLIGLLAHVEAGIDFSEEGLDCIQPEELSSGLSQVEEGISTLMDSAREGKIFRDGVAAVIVGQPNVGKSSLLNALLRTDRAIVTSIPGTTRDVLEEMLNIDGVPIRIVDTAGVQETKDPVEKEGIRRTFTSLDQADIVLVVVDGSRSLNESDHVLFNKGTGSQKKLIIINKLDLPSVLQDADITSGFPPDAPPALFRISVKTGEGLDILRQGIRDSVIQQGFEPGECPPITRQRHLNALRLAGSHIRNCQETVDGGMSGEFIAMDLRAAVDALGEITGAVGTEDILDRVFRDFCIGK